VSQLQQVSTPGANLNKEVAPSLGALLHGYRLQTGETAKTVGRRGALGPVEIAQLELGRADLTPDQLAEAVAAYGVTRRVFPSSRCQLTVDLAGGSVSVHIGAQAIEETAADCIVLTYFELLFTDGAPASPVAFTAMDLDVLRVILASRRDEVTQHLRRIVGPLEQPTTPGDALIATRRSTRNALLLLTAAATVFAGAIVVRVAASHQPAVAPVEVQIIDAVVITRAG